MKTYLSIVIPSYNEVKNLQKGVLQEIYDYLKSQKFSWEVLLVDDGSKDNTVELLKKFAAKHKGFIVFPEPHRGKGGTVIAGALKSKGEIILFTDMDQATPIKELEKIMIEFEKGYDVVIGSRSGRKGAPLLRKLMAYVFMLLRTIILRLPFKDTQCGFKAIKSESGKKIFEKMYEFYGRPSETAGVTAGFDLELLYIARKMGLSIAEVPVEWKHKETERVNPIKDSLEGLRDLLRVRIYALMGKYNT
jgi:dolichyl-phosphate beta-glucosyltransferase